MATEKQENLAINELEKYVEGKMKGNDPSHDFFHVQRVVKNAFIIASSESVSDPSDLLIIHISALLHDVADRKYCNNIDEEYENITQKLASYSIASDVINSILYIIKNISFSTEIKNQQKSEEELKEDLKNVNKENIKILLGIVRDADRLDAIGAIGVARTFAYSSNIGRPFFDQENLENSTLFHFDEKLLLLIDRMCTPSGKRIAQGRHSFLSLFKDQFLNEYQNLA